MERGSGGVAIMAELLATLFIFDRLVGVQLQQTEGAYEWSGTRAKVMRRRRSDEIEQRTPIGDKRPWQTTPGRVLTAVTDRNIVVRGNTKSVFHAFASHVNPRSRNKIERQTAGDGRRATGDDEDKDIADTHNNNRIYDEHTEDEGSESPPSLHTLTS